MSRDSCTSNSAELEALLKTIRQKLPDTIQHLLESLGEVLLNQAKEDIRAEMFPHSVFKSNRIGIQYSGSENRNLIDKGGLWNSLLREKPENVWTFNSSGHTFQLKVGSRLPYARLVHEGYSIKRDHWVPGVIDSNGNFRYKKGEKTGIMARARTFKGVPFFEVALKDLEALAPFVVARELAALFGGLN